MPALGCSDCGKPAVGTFDIAYRPQGDMSRLSSSDLSMYDRPLCKDCVTRRTSKLPAPKVIEPLDAPVATGSTATE